MASLQQRQSPLSSTQEQLNRLSSLNLTAFKDNLKKNGLYPLKPSSIEVFQLNLGKMCNQTCHHCHVDAGPDRKEIMSQETMELALGVLRKHRFSIVDLTGGAPEMNPHFRWFVKELKKTGAHILNRCNLTIILANQKYNDLPDFFKEHQVEVISSMPHYTMNHTDRQRGNGVFKKSIEALQRLNRVGYGRDSQLKLNLVYNPSGAYLPSQQSALEKDFKTRLKADWDIDFNQLFCITNMPISRYLEYLIESGNFEHYMTQLVNAFNPSSAQAVMCRSTLSVGWEGSLYDCDFNQMLDLKVDQRAPQHLRDFDLSAVQNREIIIQQHCYGCTAGAGSSCGGTVT